ncbi:MAG TPA: type III pantothenate kinase [Nitrospirae bacterium]|nr:type III pantothenate kinase [bacterium BMS3Abin10]GBE39660.1 type III pantothenate kinase [bacterium BMS3Bbin08]HDH49786.1 type III pantothenate kinase [Nitrospirota bacterium]HDK17532.1 type III pantothenate kinase [Nitrospirota bacterium]HDK82071.1 type III pantothenate kinase [Nitrospirota bacterium]
MLLLIDIGNTSTTIGIYDNGVMNTLRLDSHIKIRDASGYSSIIRNFVGQGHEGKPAGAVMCSVVPGLTPLFMEAVRTSYGIEPLNVDHSLKTGLKFSVKDPEELGADRIASAVAGRNLYTGDLIVVDFGTATTFCVITADNEYKGGSIMPGLGISADVLAEKTAKLPRVELKAPDKVPGDTPESNLLSGIILGHAGAVERIIKEIKKELFSEKTERAGQSAEISVIATGGYADLVVPYIEGVKEINRFLTLEGLRIIYELNI